MSTPITVNIPDDMLKWVKQVAQDSGQSLETIVFELLGWNPRQLMTGDVDAAIARLAECTDIQLWLVVHTRLTEAERNRLDEVSEKRFTGLSQHEHDELNALLDLIDAQMLLRSRGLALLKERGYQVSHFLNPVENK